MSRRVTLLFISFILVAAIVTEADAQRRRGRGGNSDRMHKQRKDTAPKVGDTAPTFTLQAHDGKSETSLASFKGEKPVVLFFGSYT